MLVYLLMYTWRLSACKPMILPLPPPNRTRAIDKYVTTPSFYLGSEDLNSGPHAVRALIATKQSPQHPKMFSISLHAGIAS